MTFAQPFWLLLLLLLPFLMFQYKKAAVKRHVTLQVSRLNAMKGFKTWVVYARNWIQYVRWLAMIAMIIAIARPQLRWYELETKVEAIDIMLVVDISPSMLSKDFRPDRLSVAKEIASKFISRRPHDRIGLVVFSGGAFTQCPLTTDHRILQAFVNNMQVGRLADGTAIGMGISTAVQHLDKSDLKSKVVLLITDGEDNSGELGPFTAAAIARALDVRVYCIGMGTDGLVTSPTYQNRDGSFAFATRQMKLDVRLLEQISESTGGKFYHAANSGSLSSIYPEIENIEKTKISKIEVARTTELFFWFLNAAFCLLALELMLRWGPMSVVTV
ncbi:MAG: VWA domain-containing protein [Saprospiraceae bacterium]|nr:VWA domain-containing protein [Saprospiraceae bacterium]